MPRTSTVPREGHGSGLRQARQPCRVNLPTLVVEPDPAVAETILGILDAAGIPDADLASSPQEAVRRFEEREYSAVIACDSAVAPLCALVAPDEDGDRTIPALVVVADGPAPLAHAHCPAAPVLSQAALRTHLIPCLQASLAWLGIRCKSHRFCGQRTCTTGF